jgi:hypothetical protein
MKFRYALLTAFFALLPLTLNAQKISQLPGAATLGGLEIFPADQGICPTCTVGVTSQQIAAYVQSIPLSGAFQIGNQTAIPGTAMKIDGLIENSTFPLSVEASIWGQATYAFAGVSKEFTAATVAGQGGSPITGFFSFANSNGATGDVVAILGDAVARQPSSIVFGANFIARNGAGVNGAKLVGEEIDIEPATGTTVASSSAGLYLNIFNISAVDPTPAIQLGSVGGGQWGNGVLTCCIQGYHLAVQTADPVTAKGFINTVGGTFSNTAVVLGKGVSQGIDFGGGNFGTSPFVWGDASNNLITNMGSSASVIFQTSGGTQEYIFDQFGAINTPNSAMQLRTNGIAAITIAASAAGVTIGSPTGGAKGVGTLNVASGIYSNNVLLNPVLAGTTGSIGGGALGAGACTTGTVAVTSSTTAMAVAVSPVADPGTSVSWQGFVSSAGTVTVRVCALVATTPTATTYNVRVLQ